MKHRVINSSRRTLFILVTAASAIEPSFAPACTGIQIRTTDGSIVYARTLEFADDIKSNILIVPAGTSFVGTAPGNKPGLHWTTRFPLVGMNAFGERVIVDGLNDHGLAVGLFYFPDYAQYQAVQPKDAQKTLAPWELGVFLLGTCANTQEAVVAAAGVRVADVVQKDMGFVPPVHYILTDAGGDCKVLEYTNGELKVHDNPLGVMTNSPAFDWHMTNLSNYVNLRVSNVPVIDVRGVELKALGQGSGMLGLPGDFTPPSRFVRAVAFSRSALPVKTSRQGVLEAFHILNQFDIPRGAARGTEHGRPVADFTLWTSASDLGNGRYFYRTYENSRIRMVDLKAVNMKDRSVKTIAIAGDEDIEDVSGHAK